VENEAFDLGPQPGDPPEGPQLSPQRAQVLAALRRGGPRTVTALAAALGLHPNTVREHLDGLVELGLASREQAPSSGRGRPAWRYTAEPEHVPAAARDYAALATVLAAHLARTSTAPADDAAAAGRDWGRALVAGRPARADAAQARRDVVRLLGEVGFAPEADARDRTVLLRRCPILDAARRHPDVVCHVHAGLVSGALESLGDVEDAERVELRPFAVPGACLLHLGPVQP
jgi:predicted ArsR family transcriptional regulator